MVSKVQPFGICDYCLGKIPADMGEYTSKGKPRLYCCRDCRNAANSQAGAAIRSEKAQRRVERGETRQIRAQARGTGRHMAQPIQVAGCQA
ncbi:MAG: hypothetical protein IAE79_17640 [Anaerolinea sp.]|nr:hypothetical protein [Anaerolinea sp.]